MLLNNNTKLANRYGLNMKLYRYGAELTDENLLAVIDFANEISIELTSDLTWATGGQGHKKLIGFNNPIEGTCTISTQIVNSQILEILAGGDPKKATTKTVWKNAAPGQKANYFTIVGDTVWQADDGTVFDEKLTICKAMVTPGFSATYTGDGDPQSVDLEFELASNDNDEVLITERSDKEAESVKVPSGEETTLGKSVSDLISTDTKVLLDGTVVGTLYHVDGFDKFSSSPEEQSGNYFPLHLETTGKKMTLKKNGVAAPNRTNIDFDADIVYRVEGADSTLTVEVDGKEVISLNFKEATLLAE